MTDRLHVFLVLEEYRRRTDRLHVSPVTEEYWEKAGACETPMMPYRVELVGVTADAETAVKRGIVRQVCDLIR